MLIVNCPHCERNIDVSTVLPEPGSAASITICGTCGEAFSYLSHDVTELVFDDAATKKAA